MTYTVYTTNGTPKTEKRMNDGFMRFSEANKK